jgi:hypothetical protein
MTYPNVRDCEHGRQRGKCPECEVMEFVTLTSENARLKELLGDLWCLIDDINYHIPAERFKDGD